MKGLEGTRLGRYELLCLIARGGMSEVYLGHDRRLHRQVAVKVLYGSDEPFVRRFEREARAVGTLSHDHILPLYDFGTQPPWYYLVMPFIEGGTLRDYLNKRERLTPEEAGSFLDQMATALQHAHDHGVVHRDVKPSNILLRLDGHAYLVDFGLSKAKMEAETLTHAGTMIGTPEYMAPEQSNGANDYRSDIYSLGIILYQMLTGRVPFQGDTPVAVTLKHLQAPPPPPTMFNPTINPTIEEVILKALSKVPEDRYQHARELSLAYQKALYQEQEGKTLNDATGSPQQETSDTSAQAKTSAEEQDDPAEAPSRLQLFPLDYEEAPLNAHLKQPSRIKRTWVVLPLLLLLLVSIILPFLFWKNIYQSSPQNSQQATNSTATFMPAFHLETASAQTQSAQTQATLAAQARVQATAGITSAIAAGKMLYYADLTKPGGGWIDDGTQCYFSPEGYHVTSVRSYSAAWCYTNQHAFANAVFTAQAQLLHGDFYGLAFRMNPQSRSFYVLELNHHGQYRFQRALGQDPLRWLTLIDWTSSPAIRPGYGETNTFLVVASASSFHFYINQRLIGSSFTDAAYSNGLLGFLVGGDRPGGTEAVFTNVAVFQK